MPNEDEIIVTSRGTTPMSDFVIKDSGKREEFSGGMVRDTTEGKINWALIADGPMLKRWAIHLTNGAKKYAKRNWMKAEGQEEYDRAKESAYRHFMQWYYNERDEDHASAVFFNINEAEYILGKVPIKVEWIDLNNPNNRGFIEPFQVKK